MASIKLTGDTSGEITISAPAVAGTTTLELPATSSTLATQNSLGVRNLIINGDMRIAQRGTSATGLTGGGYNTVDRFNLAAQNIGTWTQSQDTDVPTGQGFANSLKMDCTTADASLASDDFLFIQQRIEGQNLQHLKYGTSSADNITLSFWVKSNKTGTFIAELRHVDANLNYGKPYTINTADTWEKKTVTFEGYTSTAFDNDNNQSLQVNWWIGAGTTYTSGTQTTTWSGTLSDRAAALTVNLADSTSNYINITGVQLEVGTEATPFEHRPYDMELARCQRYYYSHADGNTQTIGLGNAHGATTAYIPIFFPVTMRSAPALVYNNTTNYYYFAVSGSAAYVNSLTAYAATTNQMTISGTISTSLSVGTARLLRTINADAYIHLDAEL